LDRQRGQRRRLDSRWAWGWASGWLDKAREMARFSSASKRICSAASVRSGWLSISLSSNATRKSASLLYLFTVGYFPLFLSNFTLLACYFVDPSLGDAEEKPSFFSHLLPGDCVSGPCR
jgi:hypothetical protein